MCYTGATIRLPIVSWERRFIDIGQNNDAGQGEVEVGSGDGMAGQLEGDDSESGGEDDGSGGSADGLHGMMLMSSTHHRYAGLLTIQAWSARRNAAARTRIVIAWPEASVLLSFQQQHRKEM